MTSPEERLEQRLRGSMESYMYVKSYLVFTCLPSHARLSNGRIATQAGLYSDCKSDRVNPRYEKQLAWDSAICP